jgi:hypothetical protein
MRGVEDRAPPGYAYRPTEIARAIRRGSSGAPVEQERSAMTIRRSRLVPAALLCAAALALSTAGCDARAQSSGDEAAQASTRESGGGASDTKEQEMEKSAKSSDSSDEQGAGGREADRRAIREDLLDGAQAEIHFVETDLSAEKLGAKPGRAMYAGEVKAKKSVYVVACVRATEGEAIGCDVFTFRPAKAAGLLLKAEEGARTVGTLERGAKTLVVLDSGSDFYIALEMSGELGEVDATVEGRASESDAKLAKDGFHPKRSF